MERRYKTGLVLLAVWMLASPTYAAETVQLKPVQAVYDDGSGAGMKRPEGVACTDKTLVVADTGNGRILRYAFDGVSVSQGGVIEVPKGAVPIVAQVNSKGEIYVLDAKSRRILRFSPDGVFVGPVEPSGVPSPGIIVPRSFRVHSDDTLYILDIFSARVLVLDPAARFRREIPFPKEYGFLSDLSIGAGGTVLLVDSIGKRVFSTNDGAKVPSPLADDLHDYLSFPTHIETDDGGRIYVVDKNGGGIVVLNSDGSFMSQQSGMGWKEGLLRYPSQLCINRGGTLFIADRENNRVQIFSISR